MAMSRRSAKSAHTGAFVEVGEADAGADISDGAAVLLGIGGRVVGEIVSKASQWGTAAANYLAARPDER
jgi:hypothetical protein